MLADLSQFVYAIGRTGPEGVAHLLGTCFAVTERKVVSAFHVAGPDDSHIGLILPKVASLRSYQDTSDASLQMLPLSLAAADPIRDLSIFELPPSADVQALPYEVGGTDLIPTGTPVVTLGFPHANVGRLVLTEQFARVGAMILIENSGRKSKHIVLNTQAREGQSGGPVLDISMRHVAAVVVGSFAPGGGGGISLAGVDPLTLHQTTHAVSAEYLKAML